MSNCKRCQQSRMKAVAGWQAWTVFHSTPALPHRPMSGISWNECVDILPYRDAGYLDAYGQLHLLPACDIGKASVAHGNRQHALLSQNSIP
jgi:hypothetical protein